MALPVQQYQLSDVTGFIAAAAMVWHIYLLTTNDAHHITGEALNFCDGRRCDFLPLPVKGCEKHTDVAVMLLEEYVFVKLQTEQVSEMKETFRKS
jgi:hypothetical protein